MPEKDINDIVVYSEEIRDVIGEVPSWIIRFGITLLFILFIIFLIGSWFFKYPDVLLSDITVSTKNPSVFLVAKSSGKIEKLFVKNNQIVKKNEIIAMIENNIRYNSFTKIRKLLLKISKCLRHENYNELFGININADLNLGTLQQYFELFKKSYEELKQFIRLNFLKNKKRRLENEARRYEYLIREKKQSIVNLKKEIRLSEKKYKRAKKMQKIGLISKESLEDHEVEYLRKQQNLDSGKAEIINNEIQYQKLLRMIYEQDVEYKKKKKKLILDINESFRNLDSKVLQWEKNYLIVSPIKGRISFTSYWSENQYVKSGERVFAVVPVGNSKIIGKVKLPVKGSGKVKIGQTVNIKFDNYPYMEFGTVKGLIVSKSLIPENNQYILEVDFPHRLLTNYKRELKYYPEMKGVAEIITEDIRLLERFISPIKSIFRH